MHSVQQLSNQEHNNRGLNAFLHSADKGSNLKRPTSQENQSFKKGAQKQSALNSSIMGATQNINVVIRIRPCTNSYQQNTTGMSTSYNIGKCIQEIKEKKTIVMPNGPKNNEMFTYDYVGEEDCQQDEIFKVAARPIVDQCLLGYNGTIFAYGQTGSGKTHTILGDKKSYEVVNQFEENNQMQVDQMNSSNRSFTLQYSQGSHVPTLDKSQAGILPRSFEYLFQQIQRIKAQYSQKSDRTRKSARKSIAPSHANLPTFNENCVRVEFDIKCQFIEIYNENVYDLLDNVVDNKLNIRQDSDKGVYVEGGKQEIVQNLQDVMKLVVKGNLSRSIASTQMNRESSRSHAVFITHIKTIEILENGKQNAKISRFYIVDLAGSERCKDTGAEGARLKEASNINKSLSILGNVINKLSENSKHGDTKPKTHVNYRDSKLTFLLQDSLGGNAKTVIICNVNPHIQAMKETRNTLQFAQRAKMIQNQAKVNEDTNCVEFWKTKFQQLERQITGGNALSKKNTLAKFGDQSMQECDFVCSKCQGDDTKRGRSDNQSKKDQQDYEKMNIEALRTIKEYSLQLKELRDQANINSIEVKKSIDSALAFRNSQKFQTELAKTKAMKMATEYGKLINLRQIQDPNNEIYNQELTAQINCMQVVIDSQQQEIEFLKKDLENHPLLALKCCQVIDLEKRLKELQEEYGVITSQNTLKDTIDLKINIVLDEVNRLIAKSENLYNSKKIDRMNSDVQCYSGDIEMIDTTRSNNNNLQLSQVMDFQTLNLRRDRELADIKVQYEEQLETMRVQLKKEQENVKRLKSFLTATNTAQSQYTFGDDMLQNSQISSIFQINRGQTNLMESQRQISSQHLQVGPNENPFMQTMHLPPLSQQQNQLSNLQMSSNHSHPMNSDGFQNSSVILEVQQNLEDETSQLQQVQTQLQQTMFDIAEYEKLLNDCQIEIDLLRESNVNLVSQNDQLHQMIDEKQKSFEEISAKYDEAASTNISLKTEQLQLQSRIDELQAQFEQIDIENEELINEKLGLERLEQENQELKDRVTQLEEELQNVNIVNDYFTTNALPTLQKEIALIGEQYEQLKIENQQLKELKSNDPEKDQLQQNINYLNSQLQQKDSDCVKLQQALEMTLKTVDEQKDYNLQLNHKYQELNQEYGEMKKQFEELSIKQKEMDELLDESQIALESNEAKCERLMKENTNIKAHYYSKEEKLLSRLKDTQTRLSEYQQNNTVLQNEIVNIKNENSIILSKLNEVQREMTEVRAKYVTYKNMATQQMEQMQLTVDTVTQYRKSLGTKSENNDLLIQKYRQEIEQLKDFIKKKDLEIQGVAKKLETLEEFRQRLIEKDKELKRVHDLEKETSSLRTELKIYETKCQQIEANYLMKENEFKKLQEQYEQLEKEFLDLSKLGDQAKFSHINKVRGQNNQYAKDLQNMNQEMKNLKIESKSLISLIVKFSKDVLHSLRLDNSGPRPILRANPENNMREFLQELLDVINQGFNNLHLQLETPNNVTTIRLPSYELDSNSISEESSQQFQNEQQQHHHQYQQQQHQQQQQQFNNYGVKQQQQNRQQQQQPATLQNKNINLQALNQQAMNKQRQQFQDSGLNRSIEMKENQNVNRGNNFSNQKLTNGARQYNASQQQQQNAVYSINVPIQSTKFNTQQQQMMGGMAQKQQQMTGGVRQNGNSGFAVPNQQQQQQRNNQQQINRQQSNNREPSNTRMDIC